MLGDGYPYPLSFGGNGNKSTSYRFYEHLILSLIFSVHLFSKIKLIGELKLADVFSFFIIGSLGSAIGTVAFTESFKYLNPSLVILLQKLQPLIAILLAAIILKEEIQKKFLVWAGISLLGGLLVSSPDIERFYYLIIQDSNAVSSEFALKGYGLVGISIICWGATTVFGKRLTLVGFDSKSIMAGRFLIGFITLFPFIEWNKSLLLPRGEDYLKILIMVSISGLLAMWLYYQGLKKVSAKSAAVAEMFFPFFAILLNWMVLGKHLSQLQLVGGGLLILGSIIIQLKKY
jgi:drug/metabolite transporter (DMT)-like permease